MTFDSTSASPSIQPLVPSVPLVVAASAQPKQGLPGSIMIVDDEPANVAVVRKLLERAGYTSFNTTIDAGVAFDLIKTTQPDVVILDVIMPGVSGVDVLQQIRSDPATHQIPVLILTANDDQEVQLKCLELGATDFLIKPVDPMKLVPRVRNALQIKSYQDRLTNHLEELERTISARTQELEVSRRQAVYCLARAAELRDNDTGHHVIRVGRFAGIIARNLGMPPDHVSEIELAAQLHDVGKIAVPDAILMKPGELEEDEFAIMQKHVKHGRSIIKSYTEHDAEVMRRHVEHGPELLADGSRLMRLAATIAQLHHEKFDGTGYPIGLAGEDIPLEVRITTVADVFDALSSERPYKRAIPRQECFGILEKERGRHFDPKVLDAFFRGTDEIIKVQIEFMDSE
jgi:putative two-component system response regulator